MKYLILYLFFSSIISANAKMGNCMNVIVDERLPSIIDSDMSLKSSKVYGIDKKVVVKNGAKLNIEPGTTLVGCSLFSYLVITQESKIMAQGTKEKPIVFTSQLDMLGFSSQDAVGEWGGLVIAGKAYTHYKDNKYEADESISFGSTDHSHDNDSSGILQYVMIKHTGYEVRKDRELNGLSLAGVGSGTIINNIAILGGKDDGVEIWGGTVPIKGLFVYNAMDDSVDVDLGYRGEIKDVLVIQDKVASKNNHDSSAIETGNDENLIKTDKRSATLPKIRNFTAYIKGGGIYNKYDAGFLLDNVKMISDKQQQNELLFFRGKDSYTTGAKFLQSDVCFYNPNNKKINDFFSKKNAKGNKTKYTAYDYFIKDKNNFGKGKFVASKKCKGTDESSIWRGDYSR
jgi:hypothetical protein